MMEVGEGGRVSKKVKYTQINDTKIISFSYHTGITNIIALSILHIKRTSNK